MRPHEIVTITFALCALHAGACTTTTALHQGTSTLAPRERQLVARQAREGGQGFRKLWRADLAGRSPTKTKATGKAARERHPVPPTWGLLKWDQDHSSATPGVPAGTLQAVRDEVGRVNRAAPDLPPAHLAITIYRYRAGGWFTDARFEYEAVARNEKGALLWVADDLIEPSEEPRQSLADTDRVLLGRAIARKLRAEFRP